jgi:hypothetical protein
MAISAKLLTAFGWAVIVQAIFLVFTLVRLFTAKQVRYSLSDLINPKFYLDHPIFIVLVVIAPLVFIGDLMVLSSIQSMGLERLGVQSIAIFQSITVIFNLVQFLVVSLAFRSERFDATDWILLGCWAGLILLGSLIAFVLIDKWSAVGIVQTSSSNAQR